jgi:acyl carrier protein
MNREEFLNELVELMMLESELDLSSELSSLDEWDSMTRLSVLSLFEDSLNMQIDVDDLDKLVTVQDLVTLAGF